MGHLTRCCVAVMLVCEIVAALEDPYILLTKRLNKIERNVNENFEDFRAEMTTMLDIIKGINSSVFDLKEMFLNKTTNDSYAKHTEPANAMHLMSIRNGFRAEKKARVQFTYDLDRILLSLQEHNSAVDAKLLNLERNLTDVFRRMTANRMSFTQMQENFESKQKSVEDSVRELTAGFSSTYVRWGRTSCSGSDSELVYKVIRTIQLRENTLYMNAVHFKPRQHVSSLSTSSRQVLVYLYKRRIENGYANTIPAESLANMGHRTRFYVAVMLVCKAVAALDDPYIHLTKRLNNIERNVNANFEVVRTEMTMLFDIMNRINTSVFDLKEMFLNKMKNDPNAKHTEPVYVNAAKGSSMSDLMPSSELSLQTHLMSIRKGFRAEKRARVQLTNDLDWILLSLQEHNSSVDVKLRIVERNLTDIVSTIAALKEEQRISLTNMQGKLESKQKSIEDNVRELIEDAATKKRICSPMFEKHGNSCYYAVPIQATWLNAKLICHLLDADLLKMDDLNEENVVAGVIRRSQAHRYQHFWIDGTDLMIEGTFQWFRTNGQPEKLSYNGWSNAEPNGNTKENCMMIYNLLPVDRHMKWNDRRCDDLIPFVCEKNL